MAARRGRARDERRLRRGQGGRAHLRPRGAARRRARLAGARVDVRVGRRVPPDWRRVDVRVGRRVPPDWRNLPRRHGSFLLLRRGGAALRVVRLRRRGADDRARCRRAADARHGDGGAGADGNPAAQRREHVRRGRPARLRDRSTRQTGSSPRPSPTAARQRPSRRRSSTTATAR